MSNYRNIPPEISRKLDQSVRRVRRIVAVRGACVTVAVAIASLLAIMAVDAMVTIFSSWVRWALWGCGVAATACAAFVSLARPLSRKFTAGEIAALIERNHPELEERLSTVVELAEQGDVETSSRLIEALTADAVRDAVKVSPKREFTSRTVKPRFVAALLALLVLGGLFAAFPSAMRRLATRALVPSAEVDNVYASSLRVTPGDVVLLRGSPLTVSLAVEGGFPSRAYVRTRPDGRGEAVERMVRVNAEEEGRAFYEFSYPQVDVGFVYRMNCGSALTRGYRVEVVDEPSYSGRVIEVAHPEYCARPPDCYTNTSDIVGLAGSKVSVTVTPSRSGIDGEAALPGGRSVPASKLADGRLRFEFELSKSDAGAWGIRVWDVNGFSNKLETASISIVKDEPPAVTLSQPEKTELSLPAFGEMPLDFVVKEDFGLSRVVLERCLGAGAWEDVGELEVRKSGGVTWSGDKIVRFAGMDFGKAGVVRFRVRAEDVLPADAGGPGVGHSPEVAVTLVSKNTSLARQSLQDQVSASGKAVDDIRKMLERARHHVGECAKGFLSSSSWGIDNARKVLGWAKGDVVNAEKSLDVFVEGLRDSRLESGADLFADVLSKFFTPTRQELEDVFLTAGNKEKSEACLRCRPSIQTCIDELDKARKRFNDLTKAAMNVQKLEDYAERLEALEEMAKKGEIDYDEMAKREAELEQKFKEDFKDEMKKDFAAQKRQAEQLAKRTEELAKRQEAVEKQAEAARNGTDEERKAAADAERKLADDISRLADQTADLARQVENRAGTDENDDNHTAKPEWEASQKEREASKDAKSAADKMQNGDIDGAKQDSQAVQDALKDAQEKLSEAQSKMSDKEAEFAAESRDLQDMAKAIHDAVEAAKNAAREAAEAAKQNGEQQQSQNGEQQPQNGEQQQSQNGEQKPQNGEQQQSQNGEQKPQNGEQQQSQNGEQQPQNGEQQQPQNGEQQPQNGEQQPQPGEQQQQNGQTPAQQEAGESAQKAADKMRDKAKSKAGKFDLPMDKFESGRDEDSGAEEESDAEGGDESDGKVSDKPSSKSSEGKKKGKEKKGKPKPSLAVERSQDGMQAGEEWFKMKSESGAGADVDSMSDVPEEYRALVREYFDALNKGGSK